MPFEGELDHLVRIPPPHKHLPEGKDDFIEQMGGQFHGMGAMAQAYPSHNCCRQEITGPSVEAA
jgi:hypothetical protein